MANIGAETRWRRGGKYDARENKHAVFFFYRCSLIHRDTRPEPAIRCSTLRGATRLPSAPDHRSEARLRIDPKVLVFVETLYSRLGREIAELLVYNRIK